MINILYEKLKSLNKVVYWNTGRTELNIRCPYCKDSTKDKTHAHLYIKTTIPYVFYCQRCEAKGILSRNFLKDVEIDDSEYFLKVEKVLKKFFKNTTKTDSGIEVYENSKNLKLPKYDFNGSFDKKFDYLANRLKIDFTKRDLLDLKVVNSLEDLVVLNGMEHLFTNKKFYGIMKNSDENAICFLSSDNNYVIFRYIDGRQQRYLNLSLNYPYDIGYKFFSLKNNISIFNQNLNVVLTEGIMDIISIRHNFYNKDDKDILFISANGKGFNLLPKLLNRAGFLNLNLHIYADSDVKKEFFTEKLELFRLNKLLLSYNKFPGEKDFGVSKDKINVKTLRIEI